MHSEAMAWVEDQVRALPTPTRVIDYGGRNVNGSVRGLFPPEAQYTSVDLLPGPGVDVVASAETYQPTGWVDVVVCTEVLEHAVRPEAIVRNAFAALRPGGVLLLTCAAPPREPHSGVDGGPLRWGEPYANVSSNALYGWLQDAGFAEYELEWHDSRGDLYARATKPAGVS